MPRILKNKRLPHTLFIGSPICSVCTPHKIDIPFHSGSRFSCSTVQFPMNGEEFHGRLQLGAVNNVNPYTCASPPPSPRLSSNSKSDVCQNFLHTVMYTFPTRCHSYDTSFSAFTSFTALSIFMQEPPQFFPAT